VASLCKDGVPPPRGPRSVESRLRNSKNRRINRAQRSVPMDKTILGDEVMLAEMLYILESGADFTYEQRNEFRLRLVPLIDL